MKVVVGHRVLSKSSRYTPPPADGGGFGRYEGIEFIEHIYKDHRRIKREKRRARSAAQSLPR
jgi:hypothetical protein